MVLCRVGGMVDRVRFCEFGLHHGMSGFAIGTASMLPAQGFCFSTFLAERQTRIVEQAGELIHSAW